MSKTLQLSLNDGSEEALRPLYRPPPTYLAPRPNGSDRIPSTTALSQFTAPKFTRCTPEEKMAEVLVKKRQIEMKEEEKAKNREDERRIHLFAANREDEGHIFENPFFTDNKTEYENPLYDPLEKALPEATIPYRAK